MTDGFWWAIVTVTTVGYGDMFPLTPAGRAAATVLMLLGIGCVAFITAAVAAHFVEDDNAGTAEQLARLNEQLAALADRLDRLGDLGPEVIAHPTTPADEFQPDS
jgi:voltage-gated potassium channel